MWAIGLLDRSPAGELQIACCAKLPPDERRAAWRRYEIKKTYELVCGATVRFDLNDLEPQEAAEVAEIRRLAGAKIPWQTDASVGRLYESDLADEFARTSTPNPLRRYETAQPDENGWGPFSGYFDRSCD
ncbi:MAG: hypothetical protein KGL39_12865 [Patescibacteria group bacterium]|nr:hypothetical protein [Patescibacteria group bacterium]